MTNFRLFQTKRVCRRHFQFRRKWQKAIQTGRKHCEKEKLLITSNFSISHSVFKRVVSQGRQKVSLCGKGLNDPLFNCLEQNASLCITFLPCLTPDHLYLMDWFKMVESNINMLLLLC